MINGAQDTNYSMPTGFKRFPVNNVYTEARIMGEIDFFLGHFDLVSTGDSEDGEAIVSKVNVGTRAMFEKLARMLTSRDHVHIRQELGYKLKISRRIDRSCMSRITLHMPINKDEREDPKLTLYCVEPVGG